MSQDKSWGHACLQARKEEFLKQILAYVRDQCNNWTKCEIAYLFGCSTTTARNIRAGNIDNVSFDMLYAVAMNLEMGPCVTIPEYGSYMG